MTKQDRVLKMLGQEELTFAKILLFFEDNNLILENKALYEEIERASENNKILQEDLSY